MNTEYTPQFPRLCSPLHVGKVTLRSRMCSAPMGFPDLTEDGCLTEGGIAFYENRARGGAAVVTVSEACVDYVHGKSHGRLINLQNPGALAGLTNCARAIKSHGALASVELNHAGMLSSFDVVQSEQKADEHVHYGPVDTVTANGTVVKGMDKGQIAETVECFRRGAEVVKRARFDMIMLHAGHGWLLHQFLSSTTNTRTDEYGGSLENRARLTLEVIDAIRSVVGPGFPIELRMSALAWTGLDWSQEEAIEFAKLVDGKVDIIHVSVGSEEDFHHTHPPMFAEPGCNVKYAAEIKKHVHVPVATVGALNEPEQMEQILASGQADIVCMARALLADPELPKKVEQNRTDEILRCLRCLVCHAERMLTQTRVCAVNPEIGREVQTTLAWAKPAPAQKKVLVAGGGPGGMEAAVIAARRGHDVTLCEKSGKLGGSLRCEEHVPFKSAFPKFIATMARRMELEGVKVRLNTEVTPEFVRRFRPDALLAALGAEPMLPPIPGIDGDNVLTAFDLEEQEEGIGRRVVVLGGGMVGCESGLYLAKKGHEVTVVEMRSDVAVDTNPRHRPALLEELRLHTRVLTGLRALSVTEQGLLCQDEQGTRTLVEADTVLAAAGLRPRTEQADALRCTAPIVEVLGDCVKPDIIRGAVYRGYYAALDL